MRKIRLASDNPYDDNYVDTSNAGLLTVNPIGMVPFFKKHLCGQMSLNPNAVKASYDTLNNDRGMVISCDIAGILTKHYDTEFILRHIFRNLLDEKGWSKYYTLTEVVMGETGMENPPYIIKFVFDMKAGYQTVRYGMNMNKYQTDVYIEEEKQVVYEEKPVKVKVKPKKLPEGSKLDPRSLENDFESDHSVNLGKMLSLLKTMKDKKLYTYFAEKINNYWWEIWFQIDDKVGINLRDREKLVPHFKEMGRIFGVPHLRVAYRGLRLPTFAGQYLSETYPDAQDGDVLLPQDKNLIKILTGLSYGVRSWTYDRTQAIRWSLGLVGAHKAKTSKDKVVLVYQNPKVLFDVSNFMEAQTDAEKERWDMEGSIPFDYDEKVIYLDKPVILEIQKRDGIWFVLVTNGHKILPYNPKTPDVIKNFG